MNKPSKTRQTQPTTSHTGGPEEIVQMTIEGKKERIYVVTYKIVVGDNIKTLYIAVPAEDAAGAEAQAVSKLSNKYDMDKVVIGKIEPFKS